MRAGFIKQRKKDLQEDLPPNGETPDANISSFFLFFFNKLHNLSLKKWKDANAKDANSKMSRQK